MSKYIIELNEDCKIVQQMCVTEHGNAYTDGCYSCDLEELNSDYINEHYGSLQDEAYQKGINDGSLDVKQRVEGAYQRGLEDAWEAAKKIFGYEIDGALNIDELVEAFGYKKEDVFCTADIIRANTAEQAIAKLKAYEDKQKADRIEVGDEVEWDGDKYVVTYLNYNIETSEITDYDLLAYDGSVVDHVKKCAFTKTGKHYDIQSILEAMRK